MLAWTCHYSASRLRCKRFFQYNSFLLDFLFSGVSFLFFLPICGSSSSSSFLVGKICYWMQPFSSSCYQIPLSDFFLLKFFCYNHLPVPFSLPLFNHIHHKSHHYIFYIYLSSVQLPFFCQFIFRWRLNSNKMCGETQNCQKFKYSQPVGCHSASLVLGSWMVKVASSRVWEVKNSFEMRNTISANW